MHKIFSKIFKIILILASFIVSQQSFAYNDKGVNRIRQCNKEGKPHSGYGDKLFNPAGNTEQASEYEFFTSNPHCAAILSTYLGAKIALQTAMTTCGVDKVVSGYPNIIKDYYYFALIAKKASSSGVCMAAGATAKGIYSGAFLSALEIQYDRASKFYDKTRVCGSGWMTPNSSLEGYNSYLLIKSNYKKRIEKKIRDHSKNNNTPYCAQEGNSASAQKAQRECREIFYNGIEYEDNPADGSKPCLDPVGLSLDDNKTSEDKYPRQKYYLRGLLPGVFNCDKYKNAILGKSETKQAHLKKAYNCCRKRSEEYICLHYSECDPAEEGCEDDRKATAFCKANSKCELSGKFGLANETPDSGVFKVEQKFENILCAESYNFCPFNFSVGGGAEFCDKFQESLTKEDLPQQMQDSNQDPKTYNNIDQNAIHNMGSSEIRNSDGTLNSKAGKCKNYCQYLNHCTVVSSPKDPISSEYSPYISRACINFIGDSQNTQGYNSDFIAGNLKNFSAPIAQCVKETIENLFLNKVGHSKCVNESEQPNKYEVCDTYATIESDSNDGSILTHEKGEKAKNTSFFEKIQDNMQNIVLFTLAISITLYGATILAGMRDITNKKEIMVYILKIAFIVYFTMGDAWQSTFFDGIYKTSSQLSSMLYKMTALEDEEKQDGCQFGTIVNKDGTKNYEASQQYSPGNEYLAMWDTLDCKIARYLGFGPDTTIANIGMIILAGFFTGPVGIYFSLAIMIFGIYLIVITIKSLHVFLGSAIAIVLMVFISPIIFLFLLFEKTKDFFKKWFMALISFTLQPLFLSAYIFIVITTMDTMLLGSATFNKIGSDQSITKKINCDSYCIHLDNNGGDGGIAYEGGDSGYERCVSLKDDYAKIYKPMEDSVACIIGFDQFGKLPGLEIIGLPIPILTNLLSGDVTAKIILLLKAALMIFILNKFIGEIPGISAALTGSKLDMLSLDGNSIFKKGAAAMVSIQKRASRGIKKHGKSAGKSLQKRIKSNRESISSGGNHEGRTSSSGGGNHEGGTSSSGGGNHEGGTSSSEGGNHEGREG